jgi:hypothetical protein
MGRRRGVEIEYREPAPFPDRYPQHPHAAFMNDIVQRYFPAVRGRESFQARYCLIDHYLSPQ